MSLWTDLDSVARWNFVQELTATGWQLVSNSIDYDSDQGEPVFLAPDGQLRYADGSSAPLPVSVNSGSWTDPDPPDQGGALPPALAFLIVIAAGAAIFIAARK